MLFLVSLGKIPGNVGVILLVEKKVTVAIEKLTICEFHFPFGKDIVFPQVLC